MTAWEYKVVPAPSKGLKARGIKGPEGRFANALENVMNEMAAEGWEFLRAETLPSEERSGLTSSTTTFRSVMVFRRLRSEDVSAFQPRVLEKTEPPHLAASGKTEADTLAAEPVLTKATEETPSGDSPEQSPDKTAT